MKQLQFTIPQPILNKALSICSRALSDNRVIPIYENFLFEIQSGKLKVTACDGKIIITTSVEITGDLKLKICVPGKKLLDYVSKSANESLLFGFEKHIIPEKRETIIHPKTDEPYESVTPEQINYSLTIKTKTGKCSIPCESAEDYQIISNTGAQQFELPAEDFLEALYKTMFGISDNQMMPSLTGLYVVIGEGKLTFTSCNKDLIATYSYQTGNTVANFIIPKKALQQIQSLSPAGILNCEVSKSALSLNWAEISITCLLIDEKFPDYLSVTPTGNHIDFLVSRSALLAALKRVLPFADTSKLVKLNISKDSLLLTAENIDYSEDANETIPGVSTDSIIIGANGDYLINVLNSLSDDKVWFSFSEPNRAMIISDEKHINPSKENLVLLMPVFIK